jgi:hypothetical protein
VRLVLKGVPLLCVIFLSVLSFWLFALPLRAMFSHVPMNYNEGWNALHAARFMAGGPLYPPVSNDIFINYPPLSFYLVGGLGRLMGDYIFAGRLVSLISMVVVAVNIHLIARTLGVNRLLSVMAGLVFLLFIQIYMSDYIAANDPQWLAHAFQTTALLVFLRRIDDLRPGTLVGVALLLLAGGLVKQSLVIAPLSISLWIALFDRRNLTRWILICAALVVLAIALALAAYGRPFVDQVLANQRTYGTDILIYVWNNLTLSFLPFLIFSAMALTTNWAAPRIRLLAIYLALSLVFGVILMSAVGVIYSALFDLVIAMSILSAAFCQWLVQRLDSSKEALKGRAAASAIFALPILAVLPHAFDHYDSLALDLDRQGQWEETIATLASADGPIACETLALCYWAGKQSQIDYFNFGQYAILHPEAASAFTARLDTHGFTMIQQETPLGSSRFNVDMNDTVSRNYGPLQTEPTALLTPIR